jgi:hypothetical protein
MSTHDEALALYYQLQPAAVEEYDQYILTRTPANLQADMNNILAPNLPKMMMSDTQPIPVKNSEGQDVPGSPGICRATGQESGYVELNIPTPPERRRP